MITEAQIHACDSYQKSLSTLAEIATKVKTFHWHNHILLPLLEMTRGQTYLEIGSYAGASLCLACQALTVKEVIGIDNCKVFPRQQQMILDNVSKYKRSDQSVVVHPCQSNDTTLLSQLHARRPFVDVLFIDGSHRYGDVIADFAAYSPLVKPGGIIAFDDYHDAQHSPEVHPAVDFIISSLSARSNWNVIGAIANLANAPPTTMRKSNVFLLQASLPTTPPPINFPLKPQQADPHKSTTSATDRMKK